MTPNIHFCIEHKNWEIFSPQWEKLLKLEREKYADDLEKKAKKKEFYQKQKENKQMKLTTLSTN